jgi:hypothetical protein
MPASITQGHADRFIPARRQPPARQADQRERQHALHQRLGVTAELFGAGTGAARWTEYLMVGNVRVGTRVKS